MKIEFTKSAIREYKNLIKKNKPLAERIQNEISSIQTNNNEAKGKYKNWSIHRFTFKGVQYRILYDIYNKTNTIYQIGTRENFYG